MASRTDLRVCVGQCSISWQRAHHLHPDAGRLLLTQHTDARRRSSRSASVPTLVRDMQTAVATLDVDASLAHAAALVAATQVPDLMVGRSRGAFVGVLSEGDILEFATPT